jgi:hypothetical protein
MSHSSLQLGQWRTAGRDRRPVGGRNLSYGVGWKIHRRHDDELVVQLVRRLGG